MPRFTDNQIPLGMCMGACDQDFNDVLSLVNGTTSFRLPEDVGPFGLDLKNHIFKIREKLAHPYTFQKQLDIHEMLREWRQFSKELIEVVKEAHAEVDACVAGVSQQREQTLAVSGRLLWGTLTLFVPPPVGVLLGAAVYAATEDSLRSSVQRFVEWGMQAPRPYGDPGQVAPRRRPNANPASNNSGGQEKIRDLKDIHQMIKSVEKMFGGERRKWLKDLNETTLRKLVHVPKLDGTVASYLDALVTRVCAEGQEFLKRALVGEMINLINDNDKLTRISEAATFLQHDVFSGPNPSDPSTKPKAVIREGVSVFLNRLAHEQVESVKNARGAERVPLLTQNPTLRSQLKHRMQLLSFASYFNANRESYVAAGPASAWQVPGFGRRQAPPGDTTDQFAAMYGLVPNSFFSSSYAGTILNSVLVSPLEEKLTQLNVIRKVRAPSDIMGWSPNDLAQPVPYTSIDRAFRGRLRAWADHYCGDSRALAKRKDEITTLFFAKHAPRLLAVT